MKLIALQLRQPNQTQPASFYISCFQIKWRTHESVDQGEKWELWEDQVGIKVAGTVMCDIAHSDSNGGKITEKQGHGG